MVFCAEGRNSRKVLAAVSEEMPGDAVSCSKRVGNTLVFAPTYNEVTTIQTLLDGILKNAADCDMVIVDDASGAVANVGWNWRA